MFSKKARIEDLKLKFRESNNFETLMSLEYINLS